MNFRLSHESILIWRLRYTERHACTEAVHNALKMWLVIDALVDPLRARPIRARQNPPRLADHNIQSHPPLRSHTPLAEPWTPSMRPVVSS